VPDDLRVADATERAQRGQEVNGLEQVGFALRIAAEQHVKTRLERDVEPPEIPEVTQFELGQVHAGSRYSNPVYPVHPCSFTSSTWKMDGHDSQDHYSPPSTLAAPVAAWKLVPEIILSS